MNLQEKINHNQNFSEFSETEAINLKKVASFFQDTNLQEKINHNQNFSEFSETEAINLKKVASFFQDTIHFHPGHRQPKTLIFTIRALVE